MSYTKQNFTAGQTLKAAMLNKIEDGIVANEQALAGKQPKGNYITTEAANNNYQPKGVYLTEHQKLKTIGGQSLVGDGDITIPEPNLDGYATEDFVTQKISEAELGGSGESVDLSGYLTEDEAAETYQPKGDYLTEHQKIKTINGQSLVGEGNITIESGAGNGGTFELVEEVVAVEDAFTIGGFMKPEGAVSSTTSSIRTDYIDISKYEKILVRVRTSAESVSPAVWYDADKNYISGETGVVSTTGATEYEYDTPAGAVYVIVSSAVSKSDGKGIIGYYQQSVSASADTKLSVCYISSNGDDTNDGATTDTPIATFEKAKEILDSNGELIFMEGDYWNFNVDLSAFAKISTIGSARIISYKNKITSAELLTGYTRVYSTEFKYNFNYANMWQHDIPDEMTRILESERHPVHKWRTHRLSSTRLYKATDIDTIENTTDRYMYYLDTTNKVLYFSAPSSDFENHPIIVPGNYSISASTNRTVDISGLEVLYETLNVGKLSGTISNCKAFFAQVVGCIVWDNAFGLMLNQCEAGGSANDGINGHGDGQIICYDCYVHDCQDDGESCHNNCIITQFGGLYEYNGNGCTPATMGGATYHNVYLRHINGNFPWTAGQKGTGFFASEAGESTTAPDGSRASAFMQCHGCVAEDCTYGFRATNSGDRATSVVYINCVSKECGTDYVGGTQINCVEL